MNFDEAARLCNFPTDRIALVKRNFELRNKLHSRGVALSVIGDTLHEVFKHDEPCDSCTHSSCSGLREVLERTKE